MVGQVLAEGFDRASILEIVVEDGQETLAEKWAALLPRDLQVRICLLKQNLKDFA